MLSGSSCQHPVCLAVRGGGGEDQCLVVGRTGLRCTCFRRRGRLLRAFLGVGGTCVNNGQEKVGWN